MTDQLSPETAESIGRADCPFRARIEHPHAWKHRFAWYRIQLYLTWSRNSLLLRNPKNRHRIHNIYPMNYTLRTLISLDNTTSARSVLISSSRLRLCIQVASSLHIIEKKTFVQIYHFPTDATCLIRLTLLDSIVLRKYNVVYLYRRLHNDIPTAEVTSRRPRMMILTGYDVVVVYQRQCQIIQEGWKQENENRRKYLQVERTGTVLVCVNTNFYCFTILRHLYFWAKFK